MPILGILVTLGMGHLLALTYKMVFSFYLSTHSVFLIFFFCNVIIVLHSQIYRFYVKNIRDLLWW